MKGLSNKAMAELVAEWERSTWQYKAIAATKGNQTRLGMIVLAILGIAPNNPPRLVCPTAVIDENGWIWSWFQMPSDRKGEARHEPLCKVDKLRDGLNRIADEWQFTDAERIAMFDQARKWIERDERALAEAKADPFKHLGGTLITKA